MTTDQCLYHNRKVLIIKSSSVIIIVTATSCFIPGSFTISPQNVTNANISLTIWPTLENRMKSDRHHHSYCSWGSRAPGTSLFSSPTVGDSKAENRGSSWWRFMWLSRALIITIAFQPAQHFISTFIGSVKCSLQYDAPLWFPPAAFSIFTQPNAFLLFLVIFRTCL